jgi:hypothetical protein
MERSTNFVSSIDWEHEAQKDYIFALERQRDIEASWQEWEYNKRKPANIQTNEIFARRSSFRRTYKKIIHSRSRVLVDAHQ